MSNKRSTLEFKTEITDMYGDEYTLISEYVEARKKVKILHNACKSIYEVTPCNFLKGRKCPICSLKNRYAYTTNSFKDKMKILNPKIEILGEYNGSIMSILVQCKNCGNKWESTPNRLLRDDVSCQICKKETYIRNFDLELERNSNVIRVGEFKNASTKTEFKCLIHNAIFTAKPVSISNKTAVCPECSKVKLITTEIFKKKIRGINENIEVIGEYTRNKSKIKCRCKVHNYTWDALPSTLYRGTGCPSCKRTRGEAAIAEYLNVNNLKYEQNKKYAGLVGTGGRKLSYDFYLPNQNILIEFQGKYHDGTVPIQTHEQLLIQKEHDSRKRNYAILNGIRLIEIWYYEIQVLQNILDKELLERDVIKDGLQ